MNADSLIITRIAVVVALLRMLARLVEMGHAGASEVGADECMRALDRLADALPRGPLSDIADEQCWNVAPTPPDARTLRKWADAWEAAEVPGTRTPPVSTCDEDTALRRVRALVDDAHPGLFTWRAALTRALDSLGFAPKA